MGKMVEVGKLSDDTYGIALVNSAGEFTKLHDFIFGPRTGFNVDTISTDPTWIYTGGPAVDVIVGETGRLMITVGCQMEYSSSNVPAGSSSQGGGRMSFALTGANSLLPDAFRALVNTDTLSLGGTAAHTVTATRRASYTHFLEGLDPGPTTVTAAYSATYSGKTTSFRDRTLIVQPY